MRKYTLGGAALGPAILQRENKQFVYFKQGIYVSFFHLFLIKCGFYFTTILFTKPQKLWQHLFFYFYDNHFWLSFYFERGTFFSFSFGDSVYNVRWHHVVEVRGGEGTVIDVREGKPPQSWTYKKVGKTFEKNDAVQ
ncbi:retrotransposon hot spot (RHS) protein [Trypanosoma cruzi]|nr:retrotransposon hot spot (RHS) protein [Trypanosoma cruzi]